PPPLTRSPYTTLFRSANAIVGSAKLLLTAALVGIPVGFLGGVYLAEYGRGTLASWVRYAADVLNGVPSIVIGITVYALVVIPLRSEEHTSELQSPYDL